MATEPLAKYCPIICGRSHGLLLPENLQTTQLTIGLTRPMDDDATAQLHVGEDHVFDLGGALRAHMQQIMQPRLIFVHGTYRQIIGLHTDNHWHGTPGRRGRSHGLLLAETSLRESEVSLLN